MDAAAAKLVNPPAKVGWPRHAHLAPVAHERYSDILMYLHMNNFVPLSSQPMQPASEK
jgi:hypothetical protein